jgi:hypothetical protein
MTLYFVSFFFFILSIVISHFRLIFIDSRLIEIYEKKYTMLTGLYHYLPGKYEVFLTSLIFIPVWAIQFLFSTNLNSFCEDQTLEEKILEESLNSNRELTIQLDDSLDHQLTSNLTKSGLKAPSYRKNVVILKSWKQLKGKEKFYRYIIILLPPLIYWSVNLTIQYTVAYFTKQVNFNFYNVVGNLLTVYLLVFHVSVFMPLMFMRSGCLLTGDYLWNPSCNFIIKYSEKIDMESLSKAKENYDQTYLTRVAEGEDPNREDSQEDIESGNKFWRQSKLADFANNKPQDYGSISDGDDNTDPNRGSKNKNISPFTVKYTTFDANQHEFPDKDSNENVNPETQRRMTMKTEHSEWTDDAEFSNSNNLSPSDSTKNPIKPTIMMNDNDFTDDDEEEEENKNETEVKNKSKPIYEESEDEDKQKRSSEEFENLSMERVKTMPQDNDLDDYFTDIDNKLKKDQLDLKKDASEEMSQISSEKDNDYFNVKTDREIDPNKK